MKIFEILLFLYAALMIVIVTRWGNRLRKGMIPVFHQKLVFFTAASAVLFVHMLPKPPIQRIGFITFSLLGIVYSLNLGKPFQEEARIWIGWALFWLGLTSIIALIMDSLTTKRELEPLIIIVAVPVLTPVYDWVMTRNKNLNF